MNKAVHRLRRYYGLAYVVCAICGPASGQQQQFANIGDLEQHELLTKVLKIDHVKAIIGISMGMQVFQWLLTTDETHH